RGQGIWARGALVMVALGALATVSADAMGKEPLRLAPSSNWHLNYSADSCRLARSFGKEKKDEVVLVLDQFEPGPAVNLTLTGTPVGGGSVSRKVEVLFGAGEPEQGREFEVGKMESGQPAMIILGSVIVGGKDAAQNAAITSVEIRVRGKQAVLLETGSMAAPMKALAACTDDLLRGWKIDVEAHRDLTRSVTPTSNPGYWMTSDDYPTAMVARGEQGLVYFRLLVDAAGSPSSCHIQQSTRPAEFDDAVCKGIMRRAQFKPALDAAGKPIASYYRGSVRFKM
ncbi:MAG TPA: energy transducer TonB, partial [Sphingopyxis sp.]|nr:energy transducer TonB [Sphingopyxis sp.]